MRLNMVNYQKIDQMIKECYMSELCELQKIYGQIASFVPKNSDSEELFYTYKHIGLEIKRRLDSSNAHISDKRH